jgi:hypothetical protein
MARPDGDTEVALSLPYRMGRTRRKRSPRFRSFRSQECSSDIRDLRVPRLLLQLREFPVLRPASRWRLAHKLEKTSRIRVRDTQANPCWRTT